MWFIIIFIIVIILFYFLRDVNKDNYDLRNQTLEEKFQILTNMLNEAAYNGLGRVVLINKRNYNLYKDGSNQIIHFTYGTGHLTITWKYKYYQKEVVHEKTFRNVRNLSVFEQQRMGEIIIAEMSNIIINHQRNVVI